MALTSSNPGNEEALQILQSSPHQTLEMHYLEWQLATSACCSMAIFEFDRAYEMNPAGIMSALAHGDPPSGASGGGSSGGAGPFGFSNASDALGILGAGIGVGIGAYSMGGFGAAVGGFALGAAIANAIGNGNLGVDSVGEAASYGGGF